AAHDQRFPAAAGSSSGGKRKESASARDRKSTAASLKEDRNDKKHGPTSAVAGNVDDGAAGLNGEGLGPDGNPLGAMDQPPVDEKPKITPEMLAFLKDPVPSGVFTRHDRALSKPAHSIPNLQSITWKRKLTGYTEPSPWAKPVAGLLFQTTCVLLTETIAPAVDAVDAPAVSTVAPSTVEAAIDATPQTVTTDPSVAAAIPLLPATIDHVPETVDRAQPVRVARVGSASKIIDDLEFLERGVADEALINRLKLRERRIKRRRARAQGVPPDPNDSDDSLLAELKETTDESLFPGHDFGEPIEQQEDALNFSTAMQFHDPRTLTMPSGSKVANPSRQSNRPVRTLDDDMDSAYLLRNSSDGAMTPGMMKRFERSVLEKHFKHGIFTLFKGKDEMKVSHAKVLARREIEEIRKAMTEKEAALVRLEEDLAQCRNHLVKGTSEAARLAREIKALADHEPRLKVSGILIGRRPEHEVVPEPLESDPLGFEIPDFPYLTQNRVFRALKDDYLANRDLALKSAEAIPLLEAAIIPVEHHLAVLQLQDNRLRELDQRIKEADTKEAAELSVIMKYRDLDVKKKSETERRREVREDYLATKEKEELRRRKAVQLAELEEKREQFRSRFHETLHRRESNKAAEMKAKSEADERMRRSMDELKQRITKIRRSIEKHQALIEGSSCGTDDPADSLRLINGEIDLSETRAIRDTRIAINRRKARADVVSLKELSERENRKVKILEAILREEKLRRRDVERQQEEQELHRALAGAAPSQDRAFPPFHRSAVLDVALEKRNRELTRRRRRVTEIEAQERARSSEMDLGPVNSFKLETGLSEKHEDRAALSNPCNNVPTSAERFEVNSSSDSSLHRSSESTFEGGTFLPNNGQPQSKLKTKKRLPAPDPRRSYLHAPKADNDLSYQTPPFTAEPPVLIFSDYDPQTVYRKKVVITNTSCRANSFKVLPVPVGIASCFEVEARPQGRMSAGTVCEVEFVFRPPPGYEEDVEDGKISFAAEFGGQFTVRVGCSTRKCLPRVSMVGGEGIISYRFGTAAEEAGRRQASKAARDDLDDDVGSEIGSHMPSAIVVKPNRLLMDFGACVLGGTVTRTIEITNDGALTTDFEVVEVDESSEGGSVHTTTKEGELFKFAVVSEEGSATTNASISVAKNADPQPSSQGVTAVDGAEVPPATSGQDDGVTKPEEPVPPSENADEKVSSAINYNNFKVVKNEKGSLKGYASQTIHIEFSPPYSEPGVHSTSERDRSVPKKIPSRGFYMIRFNLPNVPPLIVDCRARRLESPLRLDRQLIDYGMCVVGSVYRDKLQVFNQSNIAHKFWVEAVGMSSSSQGKSAGRLSLRLGASEIASCMASDGIDSASDATVSREDLSEDVMAGTEISDGAHAEDQPEEALDLPKLPELPVMSNPELIAPSGIVAFASQDEVLDAPAPYLPSRRPSLLTQAVSTRLPAKIKAQSSLRSDSLCLQVSELGEIEISPRLAFVQPFEPFTVWFKIKPSRAAHFLLENAAKAFEIPLVVKFVNQTVESPLSFRLTGTLTTSDISFTHHNGASDVNFGTCSIHETKEVVLRIYNHSRLPQTVKFNVSHPALSMVKDRKNDLPGGLTVIPPLAMVTKRARFEPTEVGDHMMRLVCHSIWDRKFEIVCHGKATKPPVRFNNSEIVFRAIALGSEEACEVKLIRDRSNRGTHSDGLKYIKSKAEISKADDPNNLITYELGTPTIVDLVSRTESNLMQAQHRLNHVRFDNELREEERQAIDAVLKSKRAVTKKETKVLSSVNKEGTPYKDGAIDVEKTFTVTRTSLMNPRIVLPTVKQSTSHHLPAAFGDRIPIEVKPEKGTLGPGKSVTLSVKVSPASITALAAAIAAQELANASLAPGITNAGRPASGSKLTAAHERERATREKRKEEEAKSRAGTAGTERSKGAEDTQSNDDNITAEKLGILKAYRALDDICLTILVPYTIRRSSPKLTAAAEGISVVDGAISVGESSVLANSSHSVYMRVIAPIIRPTFIVMDPDNYILDYERVPPEKTIQKQFTIFNLTSNTIKIRQRPLDPACPFKVDFPSDQVELSPSGSLTIPVLFAPTTEATYNVDFDMLSESTEAKIRLTGICIMPALQLDPPDANLYLGDIMVGDTTTKTFRIHNTGTLNLNCDLNLSTVVPLQPMPHVGARPHGTVNFNRQNAFTMTPTSAQIVPGGRQEFTIRFAPDRESDLYFDHVVIKCWGIPGERRVKLHGRCWDTSTCLIGYDQPPESKEEDRRALPPKFEFDFAHKLGVGNAAFAEDWSAEQAGGADPNPPEPVAQASQPVAAPAATSDKKKNKEREAAEKAAANISEDTIAELLRFTTRVSVRLVTLTCPWKRNEVTGKWRVDTKDLVLGNLRPLSTPKQETKKPPLAEYMIEPYNGTFKYIEEYHEFMRLPPTKVTVEDSMLKFGLDHAKGSLELGATKVLKVTLQNPVKDFWATVRSLEDLIHNNSVPGQKQAVKEMAPRSSVVTAPRPPPTPAHPAEVEDATLSAPESTAIPPTDVGSSHQSVAQSTEEVKGDTKADVKAEARLAEAEVVAQAHGKTVETDSAVGTAKEFDRPTKVETCFKVTFKGGCRFVDPKGVPGLSESPRTWIVKIVAEVPHKDEV
ncbi:hypothetical protein HK101_007385, partial [Irineochytrium annulatum]